MASLLDLNSYSLQGFAFNDTRPTTITFDKNTPSNQTININEGSIHSAPVGINLTSIISCNTVSYTVNVSSVSGATVTWPTIPPTVNITNPSPGVYIVANILGPLQWDTIKSPLIHMPRDFANNWSYTSTINYPGSSKSWTTSVNVTNLPELTTVANLSFDKNHTTHIIGFPTIIDSEPDGLYNLTVAPTTISAITSLSSSAIGANVSFNNSTKTLTINGLRASVNSALGNISMVANVNYNYDFNLIYTLTNPVSNLVTSATQILNNANATAVVSNVGSTRTYLSNTADQLIFQSNPLVISDNKSSDINYTLSLITSAGYFGANVDPSITFTGNMTGNVTLTSTKSNLNSILANIKFYPIKNHYANDTIEFKLSTNGYEQYDTIIAFNGSARTTTISGTGSTLYSTVGNTAISLNYEQANYLTSKISVIAGGGGGASGSGGTGLGGGGGGQIIEQIFDSLPMNFVIAVGGAGGGGHSGHTFGYNGGTSGIYSIDNSPIISAIGGYGGQGTNGGNYATIHTGGLAGINYTLGGGIDGGGGGGGAGANANGGPGASGSGGAYPHGGTGGNGGAGKSLTYNTSLLPLNYSAGGSGGSGNSTTSAIQVNAGSASVGAGVGGYYQLSPLHEIAPTSASYYGSGGGGASGDSLNYVNGGDGAQGAIAITFY